MATGVSASSRVCHKATGRSIDPQIKSEWFIARRALRGALRPTRKAIRPILDLDHRHCQEIIIEIGSRLRDMLSRGRIALPTAT
jgi:hypothetical protein